MAGQLADGSAHDPTGRVALLSGEARFGGDLDGGPEALWLGFVRSPIAHARITGVETAAAEALDGVVGVFCADDLGFAPYSPMPEVAGPQISRPPLAGGVVAYVGEAVAAVVAADEATAADAVGLVEVGYEPLPPVADLAAATGEGATLIHPSHGSNVVLQLTTGDAAEALDGAAVRVEAAQRYPRVCCAPMEGQAGMVVPEAGGRATVHLNTQMPALSHEQLVAVLGMEPAGLRVVVPPIGGGFGGKCTSENGMFAVAVRLALRLGKPLRLAQTRAENLLSMQARDQQQRITLGARADGTVVALDADVEADVGAYAGMGAFEPLQTQRLLPGPYRVDAVRCTARAVMTTTVPTGPYRGPGRSEAIGLLELAMDRLARRLGLDPVEVRRRNLLRSEDFPRHTPGGLVMDRADHLGALERALTLVGYEDLRSRQAARRAAGESRLPGIGVCCWADFTGRHEPCQPVSLRVAENGQVEVDSGVAPMGQGMQSIVGELCATTLGVDRSLVVAVRPDTGRFPQAMGSFGSRSASLAGSSVVTAAHDLLGRLRAAAANRLEASSDDVELRSDGTLGVRGVPAAGLGLAEFAGVASNEAFNQGQATFPGGTHVAVVEVDIETGEVEVVRHVAVTDCGRVLDAAGAEGQVQGGAVQGIALALFEEVRYDTDANPLTASFADYLVPAASDVPSVEAHFIETPTDRNPLGAKGVGESGTIGAPPAVQSAIIDAVSHLGVEHIDMPCTPERVWHAIRAAQALSR